MDVRSSGGGEGILLRKHAQRSKSFGEGERNPMHSQRGFWISIASHSALGSALCPLLRRGSGERDEWSGQFWIAVLYRGWRSEKTGIQTKLSVTQ